MTHSVPSGDCCLPEEEVMASAEISVPSNPLVLRRFPPALGCFSFWTCVQLLALGPPILV